MLDEEPLLLLLQATTPDAVDAILCDSFRFRHEGLPASKKTAWQERLSGISEAQVDELAASVDALVGACVFSGQAAGVLSDEFHADLGKLLTRIIRKRLVGWRKAAVANQVAAPRLVDFDWRVDTKTASNHLARMSVPTMILDLTIQKQPTRKGVVPGVQDVQIEFSKESLATMLDGLRKIRDQLGSI